MRDWSPEKAGGETRRTWWRCVFCGAGGSVQTKEREEELDTFFAIAKDIERAHERSPLCHILRHTSQIATSTTGAIPK